MRQIKRLPIDKAYDFGVGITDQFGLRKSAGDFVSEKEVKEYQIAEKYLEEDGKEKYGDQDNNEVEIPEDANRVVFVIEAIVEGIDEFEKKRMVDQFRGEFKDHIRQRGSAILRVTDVGVIKKRKKKNVHY